MKKFIPLGVGLCFLSLSVHAEELMPERILWEEFEQNKGKVNEIFQDKVQKISAREALPERMRILLTDQASEVRMFDLNTLQKKMEMKQRHMMEREKLKEDLRKDAENRARWAFGNEKKFQKNKENRKNKEKDAIKDVVPQNSVPQKEAESQKDAASQNNKTEK